MFVTLSLDVRVLYGEEEGEHGEHGMLMYTLSNCQGSVMMSSQRGFPRY